MFIVFIKLSQNNKLEWFEKETNLIYVTYKIPEPKIEQCGKAL